MIMGYRILLELDHAAARIAIARGAARVWEITDSFAVDLEPGEESAAMVERIRKGLQTRAGGIRGDLDLIVGRRDVELRELSLPPAPENELPEMVRFAARNEFTHFTDQTLLDFSPIRGGDNLAWTVVAGTLNGPVAKLAQDLASGLNLKLRRILVRPWCVAHALGNGMNPDRVSLVIDGGGESIEMSLWHAGHMLVARSFRPGSHDAASAGAETLDEIQRTLMVSGRATGGKSVDELLLLGSPETFPLPDREGLPPRRYVQPVSQRSGSGGNSVRGMAFAAHRGALNRLERPVGDMLDFHNPRRVVVKATDWRRVGLWGGVAAATLLMGAFFVWSLLSSQNREIAKRLQTLESLRKANAPAGNRPGVEQILGEVKLVDDWMAQRVDWLEELHQVSSRMLTPDDAIVDSMELGFEDAKTRVTLTGHVLDSETGTRIKSGLGERPFAVETGRASEDAKSREYPYIFTYKLSREPDLKAALDQISELARTNRGSQPPEPSGTGATSQEKAPSGEEPPGTGTGVTAENKNG